MRHNAPNMIGIVLAILLTTVSSNTDQTQIERYGNGKIKYQLGVPGKEPITIIETAPTSDQPPGKWVDISLERTSRDDIDVKDFMTDVIHDANGQQSRCYGPSCQDGFDGSIGPHENIEEYLSEYTDKTKDSDDRLEAISALAEKLKNVKIKDRYTSMDNVDYDDDSGGKVHTSWNRLKVKQHKHPYDDRDGWVTLEPVAWSTSKVSKWKPNVKKHKPNHWDEDDSFDQYPTLNQGNTYKRPTMARPTYINNKLHSSDWESESPKPWNKPSYNYPSSWTSDDSRRPHKPNCDNDEHYQSDPTVFYGISDSVVTDNRPSHFPYEYEALKRPLRRPTQVVYAGSPDSDGDRSSRPPHGDGQWVLLSTTRGYRNKKRQRSLSKEEPTMTSHQAVALTVLPIDKNGKNMTTSHGGLLEVERSFKSVEESKLDMDRKEYEEMNPPLPLKRTRLVTSSGPDTSSVLAAVGAGMVPATMAMVVPMMLGRRRRDINSRDVKDNAYFKYE